MEVDRWTYVSGSQVWNCKLSTEDHLLQVHKLNHCWIRQKVLRIQHVVSCNSRLMFWGMPFLTLLMWRCAASIYAGSCFIETYWQIGSVLAVIFLLICLILLNKSVNVCLCILWYGILYINYRKSYYIKQIAGLDLEPCRMSQPGNKNMLNILRLCVVLYSVGMSLWKTCLLMPLLAI